MTDPIRVCFLFSMVAIVPLIVCCTQEGHKTPPAPPPAAPEEKTSEDPAPPQREETPPGAAVADVGNVAPPAVDATPPAVDAIVSQGERTALVASARAVVAQFVDALSKGDASAARAKLISRTDFEDVVAPGFRSILGAGLLAKNEEELANLVDTLRGHQIDSWDWKPGKLVRTRPESPFARSLVQMTDGRIELQVEGAFLAVGIDQLVRLESGWAIFQMHNL